MKSSKCHENVKKLNFILQRPFFPHIQIIALRNTLNTKTFFFFALALWLNFLKGYFCQYKAN